MRKTKISKFLSLLLALGMMLSLMALPVVAAEGEDGAVFIPKRVFIQSEQNPTGTEIADRVQLVASEFVAKEVCEELPVVYGAENMAEAGDILVQTDDAMNGGQYEIKMENGIAVLKAGTSEGTMYGLRRILKMNLRGEELSEVSETPDVGQRIFHLDSGRKYFTKDWLIALIRELSWLEMNQLEFDFSNGTGFRLALDDMTLEVNGGQEDISRLPGGATDPDSWLTQDDMDEIIAAANQYGVEIVPCLDTPGHMGWIFSHGDFAKYSANEELNVEDEASREFGKALVKKFAAYFVSRGCTTFHIGGDEFLHAYVGWLGHPASTEGKYLAVANYLDSLAGELKDMGYTKIRSFNDPVYYKNSTEYTWKNIDEIEYWCYTGMNGFNYASPSYQGEKGLHMINGHGDFYDIMTDDNWQKPVGDAGTKKTPAGIYSQFHNNTFAQGAQVEDQYIYGSTYFLWCDNAGGGTQKDAAYSLYPRLRAASAKMWDENASGTFEAFAETFVDSAGGFLPSGDMQEFTLPEAGEITEIVDQAAKDKQAAEAVEEQIRNISAAGSPEDQLARVEEARKAYEALTEAQKKLVDPKALEALEKAEASYDIAGAFVSAIGTQTYTGKALTPSFTVTLDGKVLKNDVDYTASYSNNINIGTAVVKITGKGIYKGTCTSSFPIDVKKGTVYRVGNYKYRILNPAAGGKGTVAVTGFEKAKTSAVVKKTVLIGGKSFRITEIAAKALRKNKKLTKVTIGANVTKIGKQAFYGCSKLKRITISTKNLTSKSVGSKAFGKIYAKASVKVPKSKKAAYKKFLYKKGLPKSAKIK